MKRNEIKENRIKWAKFLHGEEQKKTKGFLDIGDGKRCCLGHGAFCLDVGKVFLNDFWRYGAEGNHAYAPTEFIELVGLWTYDGQMYGYDEYRLYFNPVGVVELIGTENPEFYAHGVETLADLNDSTEATPQQIGTYLLTVIEGGPNTPFKPLSDYLR